MKTRDKYDFIVGEKYYYIDSWLLTIKEVECNRSVGYPTGFYRHKGIYKHLKTIVDLSFPTFKNKKYALEYLLKLVKKKLDENNKDHEKHNKYIENRKQLLRNKMNRIQQRLIWTK